MIDNTNDAVTANQENQEKAQHAWTKLHFVLSARIVVQIMLVNQNIHKSTNMTNSATTINFSSGSAPTYAIKMAALRSNPRIDVNKAMLINP
jgi:hypothetical protein